MMPIDETHPHVTRQCPWSIAPDTGREQLLNLLCELREDPRFAEWCRLTSALGLGNLPLDQLVALHAGATETIFPEVGEWGPAFGDVFTIPTAGDGGADAILADGATSVRHMSGYAGGRTTPGVGAFVTPIEQGAHAMGGHPANTLHNTERAG